LSTITLIHPPHINSTDDRLDPPLGLLYLSSHLVKNNIDVTILDLSGKTKIELTEIPFSDYYGITVYITSEEVTKDIISKCKIINPNSKIIVGGAYPTACPDNFSYVDHVVIGYGEVALTDIIFGKEKNHIIIGKEPENFFIFPSYEYVDLNSYSRKISNNISIPYLTSRGCPYHCSFCGLEKIHSTLRYKVKFASEDIIIKHLRKIKLELGIKSINFQDDIFTLNKKRLFKILNEIKKLEINFRCMGRAGYDDEETYKKLSECGCKQISWGIESGSQYILNRMNKEVTIQDNYNVIKWAKKYGITSRAFFIIGFPGETKETLEETKQFIINSDPDQFFVSTFVPYPGTKVGDNPEEFGITNIINDHNQFFQVSKDGTGGMTTDTKWLTKEEFRKLEIKFREWIKQRNMKGILQNYEKLLYGKDI
jgi:radical SAM superfamily enzyme YgiQ (UPF0313 family)